MQRIGDYDRIRNFLTSSLLSIIKAFVKFVIFGIVMGAYDINILGIFILGSMIYVCWVLLFFL